MPGAKFAKTTMCFDETGRSEENSTFYVLCSSTATGQRPTHTNQIARCLLHEGLLARTHHELKAPVVRMKLVWRSQTQMEVWGVESHPRIVFHECFRL